MGASILFLKILLALLILVSLFLILLTLTDWGYQPTAITTFGPTSGTTTFSLTLLTNNTDSDEEEKENYNVFIAIFSGLSNSDLRNAIRNTWMQNYRANTQIKFVLGEYLDVDEELRRSVEKEARTEGDMWFMGGVSDSYMALGDRLYRLFQLIHLASSKIEDEKKQASTQHYNRSQTVALGLPTFIVKVDDDSYVRMDLLYDELDSLPKEKLYWGSMIRGGRVVTDPNNAWYNPDYTKISYAYPIYAVGGGYILTLDLARWISSSYVPLKVWTGGPEDALLGAWLSPLDLVRVDAKHSYCSKYYCSCKSNTTMVVHGLETSGLFEIYQTLMTNGDICRCPIVVQLEDMAKHRRPTFRKVHVPDLKLSVIQTRDHRVNDRFKRSGSFIFPVGTTASALPSFIFSFPTNFTT